MIKGSIILPSVGGAEISPGSHSATLRKRPADAEVWGGTGQMNLNSQLKTEGKPLSPAAREKGPQEVRAPGLSAITSLGEIASYSRMVKSKESTCSSVENSHS